MILSGFTIFSSIHSVTSHWDMNLSEHKGELPTIRLSQIENNDKLKIQPNDYKNKDYENHISYDWSDLAPKIYEITEKGMIEGEIWKDNSGTYSPSAKTEYYELRFQFLSEPMLKELMENGLEFFRFKSILYEELLDTSFDKAIVIKVKETQMLFASKGKRVIYVRYYGYADLKKNIEEIFNEVIEFE